jgi:hypothetical protein
LDLIHPRHAAIRLGVESTFLNPCSEQYFSHNLHPFFTSNQWLPAVALFKQTDGNG